MPHPAIEEPVAINPLALLFSGRILLILLEKQIGNPNIRPSPEDIRKAVQKATPEERTAVLNRARTLAAYAKAAVEALENPETKEKAIA